MMERVNFYGPSRRVDPDTRAVRKMQQRDGLQRIHRVSFWRLFFIAGKSQLQALSTTLVDRAYTQPRIIESESGCRETQQYRTTTAFSDGIEIDIRTTAPPQFGIRQKNCFESVRHNDYFGSPFGRGARAHDERLGSMSSHRHLRASASRQLYPGCPGNFLRVTSPAPAADL